MRCQHCYYLVPSLYETPSGSRLCSGCFLELTGRQPYRHEQMTATNPGRGKVTSVEVFGEWA